VAIEELAKAMTIIKRLRNNQAIETNEISLREHFDHSEDFVAWATLELL